VAEFVPAATDFPYHPGFVIHRLVLSVLVAAGFGTAVPAAGVSLPIVPDGVSIGGVEVGGLISVQAEQRLELRYGAPIRLFFGSREWSVRPARLGARAPIRAAVERALRARRGGELPLDVRVRPRAIKRYVAKLDRRFAKPAVDSRLVGLKNLAPSFTKAKPGRRVDRKAMQRRLAQALRSSYRDARIQLRVVPVAPKVTPEEYGAIVVIRRGSNRLHLYDGPQLVRSFSVATGSAEYPTPVGDFEIIVKERDPTWNPPDSEWAEGAEPIPPGPGNPLGTRWMGISAYAVGIHGTPDAASLGYSVSHGCIRMAIPEAEWLFERVEVGTPVYIVPA
jgi:lipoprotein-anchoring transpeptidase ErfK/SrfK